MNRSRTIIFVLALFGINLIFSQLANARTITIVGSRSCQQWIADRSLRSRVVSNLDWVSSALNEAWLLGLMNGMNSKVDSEKDMLYSADANLIYAWMDKYCNESKDSDVYDGAKKLLRELEINTETRKKSVKSPP